MKNIADKPLISVIVLTYNQETTIARTLESVLMQQTVYPFEVVIGEDASTDGTRAVCEEYAERHPDIVRLMPKASNKGVVRNYFDTLQACQGEFIADCAGDDYWIDPKKLQRQAEILLAREEVSVVHTAFESSENSEYSELSKNSKHSENSEISEYSEGASLIRGIALQTSHPVIHLCTALYRKSIIAEALQNDPHLLLDYPCEDLQIAYLLAKNGEAVYIKEPTLHYSIGHSSVSNPDSELKLYDFFRAATELSYEIVRRENLHGADVDAYFQGRIFALIMHLFRGDCPERLPEVMACAKRWQPNLSSKNRLAVFVLKHKPIRKMFKTLRKMVLKAKNDK